MDVSSGIIWNVKWTSRWPFLFSVGPPQFSHFSEQQANEIKVIHEFVEDNSNFVLLGDFNHGPATPGLSWELPVNYGLMTARGLLSVGALFCGQCTFCNDNVLTGGTTDVHIDHIYIPANQISSIRQVMVCDTHVYLLLLYIAITVHYVLLILFTCHKKSLPRCRKAYYYIQSINVNLHAWRL